MQLKLSGQKRYREKNVNQIQKVLPIQFKHFALQVDEPKHLLQRGTEEEPDATSN